VNDNPVTSRVTPDGKPESLSVSRVAQIAWSSAWEAAVAAFLLLLLGQIAFSILHGMFTEMTPSRPPVLHQAVLAEAQPSASATENVRGLLSRHPFGFVFLLIWPLKVGLELASYSGRARQRGFAARLHRISRFLGRHWFGLLVGNAFGAFVGALVWNILQQIPSGLWLTNLLFHLLTPLLQPLLAVLPGTATVQGLVDWYHQNQLKFAFWVFYLAAICDDLGLPNLKSLRRWARRRYFRQSSPAAPSETAPVVQRASSSDPRQP
jgi:hypothetical protein